LKWEGTTNKKITVMHNNDENQLYTTLRSYATLTKTTVDENTQHEIEHMANIDIEGKADETSVSDETTAQSGDKQLACEQCDIYREDLNKLVGMVNEIKRNNDKMVGEITSLKTTVEEITEENKVVRLVLDLKQHEWTKTESNSGKKKETEANNMTNPITSPNRFQVVAVKEDSNDMVPVISEDQPIERSEENELDQQISDYCKKQSTKFHNLKKQS
jgi:poly(3-hydroxybutyrate) depolymerase